MMLQWIGRAEHERKAREAEALFVQVFGVTDPRAWQLECSQPTVTWGEIGAWIGRHIGAMIGPALAYLV